MGDTLKAEELLKGLETKYAGDKNVTLQLIDLYIKAGKNDEALKYLQVAKAADPENFSLLFAEGIIYLNQSRYDESITSNQLSNLIFDSRTT
jgi:predicted Zn-dependent protease